MQPITATSSQEPMITDGQTTTTSINQFRNENNEQVKSSDMPQSLPTEPEMEVDIIDSKKDNEYLDEPKSTVTGSEDVSSASGSEITDSENSKVAEPLQVNKLAGVDAAEEKKSEPSSSEEMVNITPES